MWQKSLHISLMLLVYLSSTSLMISKHYCSDELMGTSFMTEAESCHDAEPVQVPCPNHPENKKEKKDCCSSELHLVKTELNYDLHQPQLKIFQFDKILPVLLYIYLDQVDLDTECQDSLLDEWDPPSPYSVDLPRLQRFLC